MYIHLFIGVQGLPKLENYTERCKGTVQKVLATDLILGLGKKRPTLLKFTGNGFFSIPDNYQQREKQDDCNCMQSPVILTFN